MTRAIWLNLVVWVAVLGGGIAVWVVAIGGIASALARLAQ